jgi:hypothetical protein
MTVAFHAPPVSVPTLVSDELITVAFSVLPVRVPAAAATVIFEAPVKDTPLIVAPGLSTLAVDALPVNGPVILVALSDVKLPDPGVVAPIVALLMVPPEITGDVNILLVSVWAAVSVAIVSPLILPLEAVSAVNVPAAGVVPPIIVPSIVPPVMSTAAGLKPTRYTLIWSISLLMASCTRSADIGAVNSDIAILLP